MHKQADLLNGALNVWPCNIRYCNAPATLRYCVGLSMRPPPYWNATFNNWQHGQQ
ncbi:unnamed protein product [Brassica oleracea var. botrytis]